MLFEVPVIDVVLVLLLFKLQIVLLVIVAVQDPDGILIPFTNCAVVVAPDASKLNGTVRLPTRLLSMVIVAVLLQKIPLKEFPVAVVLTPPILLFLTKILVAAVEPPETKIQCEGAALVLAKIIVPVAVDEPMMLPSTAFVPPTFTFPLLVTAMALKISPVFAACEIFILVMVLDLTFVVEPPATDISIAVNWLLKLPVVFEANAAPPQLIVLPPIKFPFTVKLFPWPVPGFVGVTKIARFTIEAVNTGVRAPV